MFLICNFVIMELLLFFLILFVVLVGVGWSIGKSIGNALFPSEKDNKITFIDNSVHHHHHEHKHISLIDEETKEVVEDYLIESNKKASN